MEIEFEDLFVETEEAFLTQEEAIGLYASKVRTLVCKKCGSKTFNIGTEPYVTIARCSACKIPYIIHDG